VVGGVGVVGEANAGKGDGSEAEFIVRQRAFAKNKADSSDRDSLDIGEFKGVGSL
jgi:hypothetical protein